jgi:hypothetical protein
MAAPKKFTAGELAVTAAKEIASGRMFGRKTPKGAAGNAGDIIRKRSETGGEGLGGDTNPYHSRQRTDRYNP